MVSYIEMGFIDTLSFIKSLSLISWHQDEGIEPLPLRVSFSPSPSPAGWNSEQLRDCSIPGLAGFPTGRTGEEHMGKQEVPVTVSL